MELSKQNFLDIDGKHDYMLEVETLYNNVIERFDTKNKEYFDALREFRDQYNKEYDAIDAKANQIIYGNPEGKTDRKNRDRSNLFVQVVQRSQKYKNWRNFFTAIGAAAVIILIFQVTRLFIDSNTVFVNEAFDMVCHIILVTAAWSGLLFDSAIFLKSFKYMFLPHNNKADRKWLKKYFHNIKDMINARAYMGVLVQREENIEKYLDCAERAISRDEDWQKLVNAKSEVNEIYRKTIDTKSDIISKMKKDIEKVMDDFMYDADINNALDHVLESWKNY